MNAVQQPKPDLNRILSAMGSAVQEWPGEGWSWDDRFGCPLSVVQGTECEQAETRLRNRFDKEVTGANQAELPHALAAVIARTGGLRFGQRVFFDELEGGQIRYALWWPWGDPSTVSVRAGLVD